MEDGSGDILFGHLAADQVLQVGLGEDAAARSHGVEGGGAAGEVIQLGDGYAEQGRHLVDEGAGAAGAGAVHAHIRAVALVEEDDLGVLAAHIDEGAHLRVAAVHHLGGGDHLLDEGPGVRLGDAHARRAGDEKLDRGVPQISLRLLQQQAQVARVSALWRR